MAIVSHHPRPSGARRPALVVAVTVLIAAGAVVTLARVGQLDRVLGRVEHASPELLGLAVAFEVLSFAGYVALTRIMFGPATPRIAWSESLQITLAGVVATRLVTAGGLGGIALTVWALRAAGLDARSAARRLAAFLVVLYAVFFVALVVVGTGLATGALPGGAPRGLGLAVAGLGALVVAVALASLLAPSANARRASRAAGAGGRPARLMTRLVAARALAREAIVLALETIRTRPSALAAATAWWVFDVAVLWVTFEMFGSPPAVGVLVIGYFVGQLAQIIPLPGGVGPVEGGMIGTFAACGVSIDLAVVSVLTYQLISRWLPAPPGLWGYLCLRRTVAAWRAPAGQPLRASRLSVDAAPTTAAQSGQLASAD